MTPTNSTQVQQHGSSSNPNTEHGPTNTGLNATRRFLLSGVSAIAMTAVVSVAALHNAYAQQTITIIDGQTVNVTLDLGDGDSLTVEQGGEINVPDGDAVTGVNINRLINQGEISADNGSSIVALGDGGIGELINEGSIEGSVSGLVSLGPVKSLINRGDIFGVNGSGLLVGPGENIEEWINEGSIGGEINGVVILNSVKSLINRGDIFGDGDGGEVTGLTVVGDIEELINEGSIEGGGGVLVRRSVKSLINRGGISGDIRSGISVFGDIEELMNEGSIEGSIDGVIASGSIKSLTNSSTIRGGQKGVFAVGNIATLTNSGLIEGQEAITVRREVLIDIVNPAGESIGPVIGTVEGYAITDVTNYVYRLAQPDDDNSDNLSVVNSDNSGNVSITNSGVIRSTLGPSGLAINLSGRGSDTLTLLEGSVLEGRVRWDGVGDTLNYKQRKSAALTFVGTPREFPERILYPSLASGPRVPLSVAPNEQPARFTVNAGGRPVVRASRGNETTVVVIEPTAFALADSILFDTTSGISGAVSGQARAWRTARADHHVVAAKGDKFLSAGYPEPEGWSPRLWLDLFGGLRDEEGDGTLLGARHDFGGIVSGIEGGTAYQRAGLFIGGTTGEAEVDEGSQDIDITTLFGGPYFSLQRNGYAIDGMLTVGLSEHDSKRSVNNNTVAGGRETAKADFEGVFVAPEITVSSTVGKVRPSLTLRYAGFFRDSYAEKSLSGAGLKLDDRDIHQFAARAQLGVPLTMDAGRFAAELRVGAEGRAQIGDADVSGSVLGQGFTFDPGGDNEVLTGFAGLELSYAVSSRFSLSGNIEGAYGTDDSTTGRANVAAKLKF